MQLRGRALPQYAEQPSIPITTKIRAKLSPAILGELAIWSYHRTSQVSGSNKRSHLALFIGPISSTVAGLRALAYRYKGCTLYPYKVHHTGVSIESFHVTAAQEGEHLTTPASITVFCFFLFPPQLENNSFLEDVIECLQDIVSREDLQLLVTEDEAWETVLAEAGLTRSPPQDAPTVPPSSCWAPFSVQTILLQAIFCG